MWQGSVEAPKTRVMAEALRKWGVSQNDHALLIVNEMTEPVLLSSRNIPTLKVTTANRLIVADILRADFIIMEVSALRYIQVIIKCAQGTCQALRGAVLAVFQGISSLMCLFLCTCLHSDKSICCGCPQDFLGNGLSDMSTQE